jgi:hypothetical protein
VKLCEPVVLIEQLAWAIRGNGRITGIPEHSWDRVETTGMVRRLSPSGV